MLPEFVNRCNWHVRSLMRGGVNFRRAYLGHMAAETVISHNVITSGRTGVKARSRSASGQATLSGSDIVGLLLRLGDQHREAVAEGIKSTAGVITSAAAVMVVTFAALATGSDQSINELGVGLAAAILIDATIVRAVLLPATMKLLGERNWWLPERLYWLPKLEHEASGRLHGDVCRAARRDGVPARPVVRFRGDPRSGRSCLPVSPAPRRRATKPARSRAPDGRYGGRGRS